VRATYVAFVLGVLGGLGLATVVVSTAGRQPATVAEVLGLDRADAALASRRADAVAALTSQCMRGLGFLWRPVPESPPDLPDADLDPVAWADRWGFGVSTVVELLAPTATPDPNVETLTTMPTAARDAYRRALHGSPGHPGCYERANDAVYGLRDRLLRPMRADLDALDAAIEADPGTQRAIAIWRGCVARASGGVTIDRRSLSRDLLERFAGRAMLLAPGSTELHHLQAEERRVAGVVARCEVEYAAARGRVAARHEAPFIARHREALTGIGAAIRSAEAALPGLSP